MSLKAFHVFFICLSVVLSFVVGAWGVQQYRLDGSVTGMAIAGLFYATGIALAYYCLRFLRKVKELGI